MQRNKLPGKKKHRPHGRFFLAFLKKTLYNVPDFAGGRGINPINPTRPRLKKTKKHDDGKLCYKF